MIWAYEIGIVVFNTGTTKAQTPEIENAVGDLQVIVVPVLPTRVCGLIWPV
jgi:hypothetical protein